jgi:outer membrane lipoprotein-sorting protein
MILKSEGTQMSIRKQVTVITGFLLIIVASGLILMQNNLSVQAQTTDLVELLNSAHDRYERLYVQMTTITGGNRTSHEIWLDQSRGYVRHVTMTSGTQSVMISDGEYVYLSHGPDGQPLVVLAGFDSSLPLANAILGEAGTLLAPIELTQNFINNANTRLLGEESIINRQTRNISSISPANTEIRLAVDAELGILLQVEYLAPDGSIFSTTTVDSIDVNPVFADDATLFFVDHSAYERDRERLERLFPAPPLAP